MKEWLFLQSYFSERLSIFSQGNKNLLENDFQSLIKISYGIGQQLLIKLQLI